MSLDSLIKEYNKTFKSEIVHMGESMYEYERIPFTSPILNRMTYGGIPKGKLIEFYGDEGGGKTTTALDVVANYQHMDDAKTVLYVDAENKLDKVWATLLGVDVDNMLIITPESQGAETLFEMTLKFMKTGELGLIVFDSIGALSSDKELEDDTEIGDKQFGGVALPLTKFSKQAEMYCNKYGCTLIGINQERDIINSPYGGKRTTGGKAWKYHTILRMSFRRGDFFDNNYAKLNNTAESPCGHKVMVDIIKNQTSRNDRRTGYYTLRYDIGVDYLHDVIELCTAKYGIIDKSGAWYSILDEGGNEIVKLQGAGNVYKYLEEHTDVLASVESMLEKKLKES